MNKDSIEICLLHDIGKVVAHTQHLVLYLDNSPTNQVLIW